MLRDLQSCFADFASTISTAISHLRHSMQRSLARLLESTFMGLRKRWNIAPRHSVAAPSSNDIPALADSKRGPAVTAKRIRCVCMVKNNREKFCKAHRGYVFNGNLDRPPRVFVGGIL